MEVDTQHAYEQTPYLQYLSKYIHFQNYIPVAMLDISLKNIITILCCPDQIVAQITLSNEYFFVDCHSTKLKTK